MEAPGEKIQMTHSVVTCLPGQVLEKASTFRRDFWTIFARFGSKTCFLMKFLDDSALFLLEKLKNHVMLPKNLNI